MTAEERQTVMGFLLKAGLLESMKSPTDVLKLMKSDLKNNSNKKGVKFVAAKNYLVGGKPVSLFIVTDAPASFDTVLKKQPKALKAKGTCDLVKAEGKLQVHGAWFDISTGELWVMDVNGDFERPEV